MSPARSVRRTPGRRARSGQGRGARRPAVPAATSRARPRSCDAGRGPPPPGPVCSSLKWQRRPPFLNLSTKSPAAEKRRNADGVAAADESGSGRPGGRAAACRPCPVSARSAPVGPGGRVPPRCED